MQKKKYIFGVKIQMNFFFILILLKNLRNVKYLKKIRRGPKLEGYAYANFGYSSETDGESLLRIKNELS